MINYTPGRIAPLSLRRRCVLQNIITKEAPGGLGLGVGGGGAGGVGFVIVEGLELMERPSRGMDLLVGSRAFHI